MCQGLEQNFGPSESFSGLVLDIKTWMDSTTSIENQLKAYLFNEEKGTVAEEHARKHEINGNKLIKMGLESR